MLQITKATAHKDYFIKDLDLLLFKTTQFWGVFLVKKTKKKCF